MRFVGATRIFARGTDDGRQLLAYAMSVELDEELAMVLPLPVPPSPSEDAVGFVDLQGYPSFFEDLEAAFPPDYSAMPQAKSRSTFGLPAKPKLAVHTVGLFEASFVPTRADFARLDARFRLPDEVWTRLHRYDDWGFSVFRLKPRKAGFFGSARQRIHPMALSFPRRDARALFFPTLHVHDGGTVPETANFDHALFCQVEGVLDATLPWDRSTTVLGARVDAQKSRGVVDGARDGRRLGLWGPARNTDFVLRAPPGVQVSDLSGAGECHAFTVRATHAHLLGEPDDARRRAWQVTAETNLAALAAGLRDGLRTLTAARRADWKLTTLTDSLADHFVNGDQLWTGTSYMNGRPATTFGPGRVAMRIFTERAEPQDIVLAFAELPAQSTLDRIRAELAALIDGALSR